MERFLIEKEWLDLPDTATRTEIHQNLRDISAANKYFGGISVVLHHLCDMIGETPYRQPVRILDMATGSADMPIAIVEWARERNIAVQITAVDNNPIVIEQARRNTQAYPEICVDRQDILALPYEHRIFDFVSCSQIIHHLDNDSEVSVLRSADLLSTQGIVVSDLHRRTFCMVMARVFSLLAANKLSRHDLRVSFKNAFTPDELGEVALQAGICCFEVYRHGPCRLALVVDKRNVVCKPVMDVDQAYVLV